tara:strand:- start:3011 stop:3418 length:408 start_codon:yes stop_codon:yes gene_type:complete
MQINFSNITAYDLDKGYKIADFSDVSPIVIDVKDVEEWNIYIQPMHMNLFYQNQSISITSLQWKKNSESMYKPISYEKTLVASNDSSPIPIYLSFRINLDWNTPPGNYSVPLEIIFEEKPSFLKKNKHPRRITTN